MKAKEREKKEKANEEGGEVGRKIRENGRGRRLANGLQRERERGGGEGHESRPIAGEKKKDVAQSGAPRTEKGGAARCGDAQARKRGDRGIGGGVAL